MLYLSYLTASTFRDPMLNCFWTECCSFYFAVTPFGSVNNAILESFASLIFITVLKFRSIKSSDTKILGHFNFLTKSLPEIFDFMYVLTWKRTSQKKIKIGSVGFELRTFCTFKNSLPREQTQVDLILARTEPNFGKKSFQEQDMCLQDMYRVSWV